MSRLNGHQHNGHKVDIPEARITDPPMQEKWTKFAVIQILVSVMSLACVAYQAIFVMPELKEMKRSVEVDREKELTHYKKIEGLRKAQVTESALLLLELRDNRNAAKAVSKYLKDDK